MRIHTLIAETFIEIDNDLRIALEGLKIGELDWRPSNEANSIGFTLWHQTRAEDVWISEFALGGQQIFERDRWSVTWKIALADTGFNYGKDQLFAFKIPPISELNEYAAAVRLQTLEYLHGLRPSDFDLKPDTDHPWRQGYTIGRMFGHVLCELSQHLGHIRYLRGLQRGLNN
jgi:hypothetical protein